jgi:hypothetical protein
MAGRAAVITIFGSSGCPPLSAEYQAAEALGRAIAQAGWTVCNGGYGGAMEAAARGAVAEGGHTIGVTCPNLWRNAVNEFVRQEVPTFDLLSRLNTLIRLGDAYVVLPGGTGTLLELAAVWELLNKSLLRRQRPIVILGDFWVPAVECVLRAQPDARPIERAESADGAVACIRAFFDARSNAECSEVTDTTTD